MRHEHLKDKLKTLPMEPGCYLMKNKEGTIIYVGKAKKLRNRVNQYFVGAHDFKTTKMVSNIHDFDYVVTNSEKEALLLEINLIKQHRPRYNIMFMDDSSYPYIKLSRDKAFTLTVVRDVKKNRQAKYFGPFPDAAAAHQTVKLLQGLYPVRRCATMPKKVCLYYHMHQCLGPCEFEVSDDVYEQMRKDIALFLKGDVKDLVRKLTAQRQEAAENLQFEKAQEIHQLIQSIEHVVDPSQVQAKDKKDRDVFACYHEKGYLAIEGLFIRSGKLLEKEFCLNPLYNDPYEELTTFIVQYYSEHPLPRELIVPTELDVSSLQEILDVKIIQPQKSYRKQLLDMAINNAKIHLNQKFEVMQRKEDSRDRANEQLSALLNKDIHRVELYDNSHISGTNTVGACVVYEDGEPLKSDYRLYRLHTENSDVDSMKEMIYRRYFRFLKEDGRLPDCILADGGLIQIHAIQEVLQQLDFQIDVFGLVKDDKHTTRFLLDSEGNPYEIDPQSDLFFMLTRMQDEVHRFAISYHRKLRSKSQTKSILDEIEGVGSKRKKQLLSHFKSLKAIKAASKEELMEVVPENVANHILRQFKEDDECDTIQPR